MRTADGAEEGHASFSVSSMDRIVNYVAMIARLLDK